MSDNGFSPTSRYAGIPTAVHRTADGREIVHLTRRVVPRPETLAQVTDHLVNTGDRLDNLAAQYLGDPEQFWQLCDANGAFEPVALVAEPGERLRVTLPRGVPGPSQL